MKLGEFIVALSDADKVALVDQIADEMHALWSEWADELFGRCFLNDKKETVIEVDTVKSWTELAGKNFADLDYDDKNWSRSQAEEIIAVLCGGVPTRG